MINADEMVDQTQLIRLLFEVLINLLNLIEHTKKMVVLEINYHNLEHT